MAEESAPGYPAYRTAIRALHLTPIGPSEEEWFDCTLAYLTAVEALDVAPSSLDEGDHAMWHRLSAMMSWDAVLEVARSVGGILGSPSIKPYDFRAMFPNTARVVKCFEEAEALPSGCFVGFIEIDPYGPILLKHAMIHTAAGMAAGTNNRSIFPKNPKKGWAVHDLSKFFDTVPYITGNMKMVFREINGEVI